MEENNIVETEKMTNENIEADKKKSRNWNIFIGIATAVGVALFGALGALVGCLGSFLSKLIWTKTTMNKFFKVIIIAVIWIILIVFYLVVVTAISSL